jgi:hypothetical protein
LIFSTLYIPDFFLHFSNTFGFNYLFISFFHALYFVLLRRLLALLAMMRLHWITASSHFDEC